MPKELSELLDQTRTIEPDAQQREDQRRSFAYGNTRFENEQITRELVDRMAVQLAADTSRR